MNALNNLSMSIIGMAAHAEGANLADLVNHLYHGTLESPDAGTVYTPTLAQILDNAFDDARISAGPDIALILLGNSTASSTRVGSVYASPGIAQALLLARTLLTEQPVRAVVVAETGIGAVVLASGFDWARIYATVESIGSNAAEALAAANCQAGDIGYLELAHLMPEDTAEVGDVMAAYCAAGSDLICAVGSSGRASKLLALITTVLCVYHRFIPAIPGWKGPTDAALWKGGPFYAMTYSKTWFLEPGQIVRRAALNSPGGHLVLAEHPDGKVRPNTFLRASSLKAFIVTADDGTTLLSQLHALDQAVREGTSLPALADDFAAAYQDRLGAYTAVLLGRHPDELRREIDLTMNGIPSALEQGNEWLTPFGSYFTANPLGRTGKIAFVYPGAFSGYPRMGQDLPFLFPYLHEDLMDCTSDLGRALGDPWIYPRSLEKQTTRHWKQIRRDLESHPTVLMEAGVTASVMFTRLVRDVFNIRPDMALGYSLGENSMMFGLGIWTDGDEGHERLITSPIYQDRLFGVKNAVREMWGLPPETPDDFWSVYFIAAPVERVEAEVEKESRVYLTHINSPNEVVIAGESEACKRIVAAVGAEHLHAPFSSVIHCDMTLSDYGGFYHMNHHPVQNRPEAVLYSAADYAPIPLDSTVIAHSIARAASKTLDFPRLVHRVYEDGARIFIELGPRSSCARWISDTLGTREHLSVSTNRLGGDDLTTLLRMVARLVSHGVPMDLSTLYSVRAPRRVSADLLEPYHQTTQAHKVFLEKRLEGLQQLGEMLRLQMQVYAQPALAGAGANISPTRNAGQMRQMPPPRPPVEARPSRSPAMFDEQALQKFATGSIMACFGSDYAVYEQRRAPRIPNGDLLMISRIVEIKAERYTIKPGARMVSEYDVPDRPWFYRDNAYPTIPYSIYMEMALQLCGFLTAYLGSSLAFPDLDFYFRNLDGQGTLSRDVDLSGKTVTNLVYLLSSITMDGIILQKFSFQMALDGDVFYTGEASFGFFTDQAMRSQAGLDKGLATLPWYQQQNLPAVPVHNPATYYRAQPGKPHYRLAQRQLDLLDTYMIMPNSGQYGLGYIYASKKLSPTDWYFTCHFYQDPVMPGSLGVEAIIQAMQAFALELDLGRSFGSPCFKQTTPHTVTWHYRGQVTRHNSRVAIEIHVKRIETTSELVTIIGDASLWRDDGLRIYEVLDIALSIQESAETNEVWIHDANER